MTAQIARLSAIRPSRPPELPGPIQRVRDLFWLGSMGPCIAWEVWRTGARSYVMIADGRAFLSVSGSVRFANRKEARTWAKAYFSGLGMESLPERRKKVRNENDIK